MQTTRKKKRSIPKRGNFPFPTGEGGRGLGQDEMRGRFLPRQQWRHGRGLRTQRRARHARRARLAHGDRSQPLRCGRAARWLLLRRLPARRGDRPLRAGDGRGRGVRGGGAARARHLQRLPGAHRSGTAARRADAQRGACSSASRWVHIRVERTETAWTADIPQGTILRLPIAHGEGRYVVDAETLRHLEDERQIVFRYCTPDRRDDARCGPERRDGAHRRASATRRAMSSA